MRYYKYIILFFCLKTFGQQTGQFTQFTFNKYGYNPAAAGTNINGGLEVIVGIRRQWIGFENAPRTNFFSTNYTFKPKRSYKRWHNVGVYMNKEKAGIFRNEGFYASYTLHMPMTNKFNMSFGIFAGVRNLAMDRGTIAMADPVYGVSHPRFFLAYPDFIPGIRIYNKKIFFDVSIQQVFKTRQTQGSKQIGNKSVLTPHLYVSFGKKFFLDNDLTIAPAVNLISSFAGIPSLEINVMAYYRKRIGLGTTIRNKDFISGIIQIGILKNVTAGFSYDYSINRMNSVAPNTLEFMIGLTPIMSTMGVTKGSHSVSKCPNFDF